MSVFHSPHEEHWPIHLGDSCPQSEHTYTRPASKCRVVLILLVVVLLLVGCIVHA